MRWAFGKAGRFLLRVSHVVTVKHPVGLQPSEDSAELGIPMVHWYGWQFILVVG